MSYSILKRKEQGVEGKKEKGKRKKLEERRKKKRGEKEEKEKKKKKKRRARINQFFKTLQHLVVSFPSNQRYRLQLPSYSISLQTS